MRKASDEFVSFYVVFSGVDLSNFLARDCDKKIDTIKKGAGDFVCIILDLYWPASTLLYWITKVTTRAGILTGDECKIGRIGDF